MIVTVARPKGAESPLRHHSLGSGSLPVRPGLAARIAGSSRRGKGLLMGSPCYSSTLGAVMTHPWKSVAGRIWASCSEMAPE